MSAPVRVIGDPLAGSVLLICEHASGEVVPPWSISTPDRPWLSTHWGQDRGAASLTEALGVRLGCPAVLAGFSRLLCDANRPPDAWDLCRPEVEGHALELNRAVDASERARRLALLHAPYHAAIDTVLTARGQAGVPTLLFSVHCFTDNYNGEPREVQLGVLFDDPAEQAPGGRAHEMVRHLRAVGSASGQGPWDVRFNEPWSGMKGLTYSPLRHSRAHNVPYLEIEVRDDLLVDGTGRQKPEGTAAIADALAGALEALTGT